MLLRTFVIYMSLMLVVWLSSLSSCHCWSVWLSLLCHSICEICNLANSVVR